MAGRPPKAGSVRAKAAREARAMMTGEDPVPPKSEKHAAAARLGHAKRLNSYAKKAPPPPPKGVTVHNVALKSLVQRAMTKHAENLNSAQVMLSAAIPEAAQFLRSLVRGEVEGATVENRVTAAKLVLTSGGMLGEGGKSGRAGGLGAAGSVNDMTADELRAFIAAGAQTLAAIEASDAVLVGESRTTDPGITPDESAS